MDDYRLVMPTNSLRAFADTVIKDVEELGGWRISMPTLVFIHTAGPTWSTFCYTFNVTNLAEDNILFLTLKHGIIAEKR